MFSSVAFEPVISTLTTDGVKEGIAGYQAQGKFVSRLGVAHKAITKQLHVLKKIRK